MKKIFLVTILILLILVGVTLVINRDQTSEVVVPTPTFPDTGSPLNPVVDADTAITVATAAGMVRVADVRTYPEVKELGDGMYHLQGTRTDATAGFAFLYSFQDNSVSIAIEAEPFAQNRLRASQYVLELLKLSETDACKLNVFVGIPYTVNKELSGKNLGLSFCPNSVPL